MKKIVGVTLNGGNKIYHFDSNKQTLEKDDYVIVETERGFTFGQVVNPPYEVEDKDIGKALKLVIRKADQKDIKT